MLLSLKNIKDKRLATNVLSQPAKNTYLKHSFRIFERFNCM